ncbi:MarR family transcriptional regulator [Pedobacter frigidisoli]|uniref:MarR family transcriptional regulator n=1 Tax=Pedobacter frigidisoli TaxID=2530455 RepID=A0A4R0NW28_9SPHI|nr:MarR family transcriptional regulator [Pedobacter frigidisoli]TCD05891.1 MarR family transcriptional regulator [Pedobacter frigidisoli]
MENPLPTERLIFRLMDMLKKQMEKLATVQLAKLISPDFNLTYVPYFMSIGETGISNHELLEKIMVTKQGVSKIVKELERLELIYSVKSKQDARSIMIYLTKKGHILNIAIKKMAATTTAEYSNLLGAKKYEQLLDSLVKIQAHNQQLLEKIGRGTP